MAGENSIQQYNPHPELDDVWQCYNDASTEWIRWRMDRGFPLPPLATEKRMNMLKTVLTLRTIGILKSPTGR